MSILNGAVRHEVIAPEKPPFGAEIRELGVLDMRGWADCAALDAQTLVCAGGGSLTVWQIGETPALLGTVDGLGDARQLCIADGYAYLTTRTDGIYICEVKNPRAPRCVAHLDSIELATGVAAGNGVLAVVNRHMGCDLYDVRTPESPVFRTQFYCGEAQSVWMHQNLIAIGDWMNRRVWLCDLSVRPVRPIAHLSVDGFADGVCIIERDGRTYLLAVSGHHANKLRNRRKYQNYPYLTAEMIADGYGGGHGLTVYDITDPAWPEWVSELKAPPQFAHPDTWRVFSDGTAAFFTDSVSGLFTVDLSDLFHPVFTGYYKPAPTDRPQRSLTVQLNSDAVVGAAVCGGHLFAATAQSGVRMLDYPAEAPWVCSDPTVMPEPSEPTAPDSWTRVWHGGAAHGFAECGGRVYIAAGDRGLCTEDGRVRIPGIVYDVQAWGDYLLVAEGARGLACYRPDGDTLRLCSRADVTFRHSARFTATDGSVVCVELGCEYVQFFRIDNGILTPIADPAYGGLQYHRHLSRTVANGRFAVQALQRMTLWDPSELPNRTTLMQEHCPFSDGVCGFGRYAVGVFNRRWFCVDGARTAPLSETELSEVPGAWLDGQPFAIGDRVLLLNRCNGRVEWLDLHDPAAPVLLGSAETALHPEFAAEIRGQLWIACGRAGIFAVPAPETEKKD